jgi:hypothetical protein
MAAKSLINSCLSPPATLSGIVYRFLPKREPQGTEIRGRGLRKSFFLTAKLQTYSETAKSFAENINQASYN